jgi:hypothetical protein
LLRLETTASTDTVNRKKKSRPHTSNSQLTVSGLDGNFTVLFFAASDLATLPAKRGETLSKDGVRIVVASIEGVSVHGAQVLDLKLEEGGSKLIGESETLGKFICRRY